MKLMKTLKPIAALVLTVGLGIGCAEDDSAEDLDLSPLAHVITLDDIEKHFGLSILPADRNKLDVKWQQKKLDPALKSLLANNAVMSQGYMLIPRVSRFFKKDQTTPLNMVYMLRNFAKMFENVSQVINYKAESFFTQQTPTLEWAIVSCEAVPDSLNQNYMQQRHAIKPYAQALNVGLRRIQRRTLIETLYDIIILHLAKNEKSLEQTTELTETKVGRQNFACVNFGPEGIRISDVGRQQTHAQMGFCPNW